MRSRLFYLTILAAFAMLQSCDSRERLARNIEGSWTSNPESLDMPAASSASATPTYSFSRDDTGNGGTVTLTAMLQASRPINTPDPEILEPIRTSASGVATIEGTWKAVDDDEIFLMFDPQSVSVSVDPTAVELIYNNLDQQSAPALETLKAGITEQLKQEFTTAVDRRFLTSHRLDDVKFRDNGIVEWEVGDKHYTLSRQQ